MFSSKLAASSAVRACLALLCCLQMVHVASAREGSKRERAVDRLFQSSERKNAPGLAVGIWQGGQAVYVRGYGLADLEQGTAITAQTVFYLASVSKQFTAFAIALLARDGKVNLDADIRTYLPYVPDFGTPLTIRELLHHTNGLRDEAELFITSGRMDENLQQQVLNMVARQRGLNFAPGSEYSYNNTGYTLLGEVVKAVSGKTLRRFTTERMFEPLGMHHTFFADRIGEIVPGRAQSYGADTAGWKGRPQVADVVGSGGLLTTLEDMMKWVGNFSEPRVGDAALIEEVTTSGKLANGKSVDYAFGLERREILGHQVIQHAGYDAGFRAILRYFPREKFAVVILRNDSGDLHRPSEAITALYLNEDQGPRVDYPAASEIPPGVLSSAGGHYLSRYGQMVTIEGTEGRLTWRTAYRPGSAVQFRRDGSFDLGEADRIWSHFVPKLDSQRRMTGFIEIATDGGGTETPYERVMPAAPSAQELVGLAGDYYSPELEMKYTFSVEQGALVARNMWLTKTLKFAPSAKDRYDSLDWEMSVVQFERDAAGRSRGLHAHVGRGRNLWFVRQ